MDLIKLYLISGAVLYAKDKIEILRMTLNSSNNGRAIVYDCFKDEACTQKAVLNLANLEYFEKIG